MLRTLNLNQSKNITLAVGLLLASPAFAGVLDTPLGDWLSPPNLRQINRELGGPAVAPETPVRHILSRRFWPNTETIALEIRKDNSPFYRAPKHRAELLLRDALVARDLTLNLSAEDIARIDAGEHPADLTPLIRLQFNGLTNYVLDPLRWRAFALFVVRDFDRAYAAELTLPPEHRFIKNYKSQTELVEHLRATIDRALNRAACVESLEILVSAP